VPPSDCGVVALSEFVEPMITVREKGLVPDAGPTTSCNPDGLDANESTTVCGSRRTLVVVDAPFESVAVSCSSRYDG
jgi:hypothetical protein